MNSTSELTNAKISVKLQGGLGNQLFQYATARKLADQFGVPLVLDLYYLESTLLSSIHETPRQYDLTPYKIEADIVRPSKSIWQRLLPKKILKLYYRDLHYRSYKNRKGDTILEQEIHEAIQNGQSILLEGFYQNEMYFLEIREKLVSQLQLDLAFSDYYHKRLEEITNTTSVSVHIRRGDYAHHLNTQIYHGLLDPEYYRKAILLLQEKCPNATYYFFSDDIEWVKASFSNMEGAVFIQSTSPNHHAELELMRRCKHQIIANSSFSWWGAWLNDNPEKAIIAPAQWFADPTANNEMTLPKDWLRL